MPALIKLPKSNSYRFKAVMAALNLNPEHCRYHPRNTLIRAKKAEVDADALKEMVGHKIQDITESVCTLRDLELLCINSQKNQVGPIFSPT